jgi:lipoprotein NlpD
VKPPEVVTISGEGLDPVEAGSEYVVRSGDTLFSIAWRFNQNPETLKRRNRLDSDLIRPGQRLKLKGPIPEPEPVAVKPPPVVKAERQTPPETEPPKPAVETPQEPTPDRKPEPQPDSQPKPPQAPQAPPAAVPAFAGWQWPVEGPVLAGFSTKTRFSRSLQLGGEVGTPVKAAASGRVVYSGDGLVGFGNLVIISHDNQFLSAYGHNQALLVNVGDVVSGGEVIARMGSTGTDRVKLHFEVRKAGKPVNPADLLPTRS